MGMVPFLIPFLISGMYLVESEVEWNGSILDFRDGWFHSIVFLGDGTFPFCRMVGWMGGG